MLALLHSSKRVAVIAQQQTCCRSEHAGSVDGCRSARASLYVPERLLRLGLRWLCGLGRQASWVTAASGVHASDSPALRGPV